MFAEKEGVRSIHQHTLPELPPADGSALELGSRAVEAISCLRKWKQTSGLSLGAPLSGVRLGTPGAAALEQARPEIAGTLRIEELVLEEHPELKVLEVAA